MRSRPDTAQFKPPIKDPTEFLNGAGAEPPAVAPVKVEKTKSAAQPAPRIHREQKIFRLPITMIAALRREAYERTEKSGNRVTETDLVEQALKKYLSL